MTKPNICWHIINFNPFKVTLPILMRALNITDICNLCLVELFPAIYSHSCWLILHMLLNTEQIVHKQSAANGKGSVYFKETVCWLRRASLDGATTHQWLNLFWRKLRIIKRRTFSSVHARLRMYTDNRAGTLGSAECQNKQIWCRLVLHTPMTW